MKKVYCKNCKYTIMGSCFFGKEKKEINEFNGDYTFSTKGRIKDNCQGECSNYKRKWWIVWT